MTSRKKLPSASASRISSAKTKMKANDVGIVDLEQELACSREQLQLLVAKHELAIEELRTVNKELQTRILESSQLNNDLENLIESVELAIIIVGRDLKIRRFSPKAEKLLNILPSDLGRPISDISLRNGCPNLDNLLHETIDSLTTRETEVQVNKGRWFSLRTRPYLTLDKKIEGAVILLMDVDSIRGAREYSENIVATVREPLVVLDCDLCVRSASPAFYQVFKLQRDKIEGHLFSDLGNGEWDTPELSQLLIRCLVEGTTFSEFAIDGEFKSLGARNLLLNARRISQPADQSPLILLAIEDRTKHRQVEQLEAKAQLQFETIFEASPVGMYLLDSELRFLQIGRIARSVFGEIDELVGRDFIEVVNSLWLQENAKEIVACFRHTLKTGEPYFAPAFSDLRKDLNVREYYDWQIHRIALANGQYGIVCYFLDMSARMRAESSLRTSEVHYRRLFEAAKDGVLILDPLTRKINDANPFICELLGYSQSELLGKELFEIGLLKDEEASQLAFLELKEKGFIRYEDLPLKSKSGERREVEMVSNLYDEDGDSVIQCNIRDITERRRLQRDLRERNEELLAADSRKNNFLAVLAHELRTPLNAIRGWIQLIQRPGQSAENLRQGLEVIDRSSLIQAKLIEDLLTGHRITSGKMRMEVSELDLDKTVQAAIAGVSLTASAKDIKIEFKSESKPVLLFGDVNHLQQVFGNLLVNAIKFSHPNSKISVAIHSTELMAEVSVADTGEGISLDELPKMFEPFRQANPSTNRKHGGLGLGLSIAKQLVELHGGNILAKSAGKGQGSTFVVCLPLKLPEAKKPPKPFTEDARDYQTELFPDDIRSEGMLGGVKILVVDDDVDAREPLRQFLEQARAEVITVGSADEAVKVVREQLPDIVVSDIGMPGRDGYDFIRSIRVLSPECGGLTPAIALTSYSAPEDIHRSLNSGFDCHLAKPVESEKLITAIATLLGRT